MIMTTCLHAHMHMLNSSRRFHKKMFSSKAPAASSGYVGTMSRVQYTYCIHTVVEAAKNSTWEFGTYLCRGIFRSAAICEMGRIDLSVQSHPKPHSGTRVFCTVATFTATTANGRMPRDGACAQSFVTLGALLAVEGKSWPQEQRRPVYCLPGLHVGLISPVVLKNFSSGQQWSRLAQGKIAFTCHPSNGRGG